jgi:hypothetical protein
MLHWILRTARQEERINESAWEQEFYETPKTKDIATIVVES